MLTTCGKICVEYKKKGLIYLVLLMEERWFSKKTFNIGSHVCLKRSMLHIFQKFTGKSRPAQPIFTRPGDPIEIEKLLTSCSIIPVNSANSTANSIWPHRKVKPQPFTILETNSKILKIRHPKKKQSYSNHPFSGAKMLVYWKENPFFSGWVVGLKLIKTGFVSGSNP